MFTKRAVGIYPALVRNIGATKRVFNILNQTPNILRLGGTCVAPPSPCLYGFHDPDTVEHRQPQALCGDLVINKNLEGSIEFRNVCFVYPSRPSVKVIDGLSFKINAGQTVGIVGQSGNGKSTIVNLLMRFYDPTDGSILIDGVDLRQYDLRWLHRHKIGYVGQEPLLFNQSIKWNICYGSLFGEDSIDDERLIDVAKRAQCYSFIMELEHQFDTVCGERGTQLSGGQKQRIAIARALYHDPKILIFDEASSALDAKNEHLIHESLRSVQNGKQKKTIVLIAHRLSTINNADKIVVVQKGKIVECGTHDQLFENECGEYYKLIQKQMQLQ